MSHEVTLRHMKNNEKGIITQVNASGELGRRIRDMGLVKQTEITVIGRAPLKDPVALRLKDFTLTLRNKEADHIRVRVEREDEMEEIVKEADLCIALAGNPNAGKTTIFNALTGAKQRVGNYPGVTVAKREGLMNVDGLKVTVADLPGIYSLTPYSEEEIAARIHLIHNRPDGIINVVDANTLERNLYLTIQLLELGIPVVLDLNMIDEVRKKGTEINTAKLASILRIPVVETNGRTGEGKIEMIKEAIRFVREKVGKTEPLYVSYGTDLDEAILRMEKIIIENQFLTETLPPRWIATKLLEKDSHLKAMETKKEDVLEQLLDIVDQVSKHCKNTLNTDPEELIADYRYGYITSILTSDVIVRNDRSGRLEMSDKIDKVVTNTLSGPIIMLVVLYSMFQITFTLGEYPMGWLESLFGLLGTGAKALIPEGILQSLIVSGVIDGVGGVLSFAPLILIMFFMISFLEDSGYMARIAYILDKLMQKVGLHGASVMPYIISGGIVGGCAVPGVMATRTLKSPKEKIATILTAPFLTCGAKTPVVMLLAAAFFPNDGARVLFWTVLCSWAVALLVARLLRSTIIRGESTPFVMELPPYRMPTTRGMLIHTWERTWQYIKKAGTVILAVSVFIWALMTFPLLPANERAEFEAQRDQVRKQSTLVVEGEQKESLKQKLLLIENIEASAGLRNSLAGRLGIAMESGSRYAGFDWQTNIALIGGFAAKEVIVASLATAYSMGDVDPNDSSGLSDRLANNPNWNFMTAISLLVFVMLYSPCFVTVVAISKELSWKWAGFSIVFNTLLAFSLAVAVYQVGTFIYFSP